MNRKKILVINLGWEQEPLLDKLSELGVNIYGVHYNDSYYKAPKYKDMLITDLRDLVKISRFAEKVKPNAVISDQCDYSYFAQSLIAEKLNLPGPRIMEAQRATNKYLQRTVSKQANILIPEFQLCTAIYDLYQFIDKVGLPVITKPVDNRGSFGINKIKEEKDIPNAFYDALANCHSRLVLAEKFINGIDITVDGYMFQGIGPRALGLATKQKLEDKGGIIDGEIIYPGDLDDELYDKTIMNAEYVAENLGLSFGFFHGEFIITTEGDVYLTEIANRGGGVFTSEIIVPHVSGIDILDVYIKDVFGISTGIKSVKVNKIPTLMKFFSFPNLKGKEVKNIKGIKDVEDDVHTLKLKMLIKKGYKIPEIRSGADRHGVIIVTTSGKEQLVSQTKSLLDRLEVECE
ncbi:MAG: ATP-grasp domain-containing protein [Proteobacteria bacterium]|nr:ATP-grasp domain-containing protein [Pseudomonadota bacterium]